MLSNNINLMSINIEKEINMNKIKNWDMNLIKETLENKLHEKSLSGKILSFLYFKCKTCDKIVNERLSCEGCNTLYCKECHFNNTYKCECCDIDYCTICKGEDFIYNSIECDCCNKLHCEDCVEKEMKYCESCGCNTCDTCNEENDMTYERTLIHNEEIIMCNVCLNDDIENDSDSDEDSEIEVAINETDRGFNGFNFNGLGDMFNELANINIPEGTPQEVLRQIMEEIRTIVRRRREEQESEEEEPEITNLFD